MFAFSQTVNIVRQGTRCLDDCHPHLFFSTAPRPRSRYSVPQFLLEAVDTHRCPSRRQQLAACPPGRPPCGHSPACPLRLYPTFAPARDDEQPAQTPAALRGRGRPSEGGGCPAPFSPGRRSSRLPLPPQSRPPFRPAPRSSAAERRPPSRSAPASVGRRPEGQAKPARGGVAPSRRPGRK